MITNSSSIITFFQLNLENELTKLSQTGRFSFLVPYAVFNELRTETRKFVQKMVDRGIFALYRNKIATLNSVAKLFPSLGNGELSVLSAYLEIKNYLKQDEEAIAIIDEKLARKKARELNVKFRGTLFIIVSLVRESFLDKDQAIRLLQKLPNIGFYINDHLLQELKNKIRRN